MRHFISLVLSLFSLQIGLVAAPTPSINRGQDLFVPILMYHHILDYPAPDPYFVSPDIFDKQMAWLRDNHYNVVRYEDFYHAARGEKTLPPHSVVISFDDGDIDQYTNAFPILKKYHYSAIFYIPSNFIDHSHWMTLKMVEELRDSGMEIAGHTVTHKILTQIPIEKQRKEIGFGKKSLEKQLDMPINFFAYPGGMHSSSSVALVKEFGFLSAATTHHSGHHLPGEDPYLVPRLHINNDLESFIGMMEGKRTD